MKERIGTTTDGRAIFLDQDGNQFIGGYQPKTAPDNLEPPRVKPAHKPEKARNHSEEE